MAENCSHTMHNLVSIRGALVRNSLKWSKYIHEAIELFGAEAKILFTSHNWPRWGGEDLMGFLTLQRDLYRWMQVSFKKGFKDKPVKKHSTSSSASIKDIRSATTTFVSSLILPTSSQAIKIFGFVIPDCVRRSSLMYCTTALKTLSMFSKFPAFLGINAL